MWETMKNDFVRFVISSQGREVSGFVFTILFIAIPAVLTALWFLVGAMVAIGGDAGSADWGKYFTMVFWIVLVDIVCAAVVWMENAYWRSKGYV